jgi:hypothetical protein
MLEDTVKSTDQSAANAIPDPWEAELPTEPKPAHPVWQFPLDPHHEIPAAPAPDGILSPQGDLAALQIPAHASHPEPSSTEVLLQEELKLDATQAKSLWDHIRDLLALLWWSGPQDEQST